MTHNFNNKPKRNHFWDIDYFDAFTAFVIVCVVIGFISMPIVWYFKVTSLQRILNTECKGDYGFVDVALNGDNLLQACRINNQSITIK